MFDTIIIDTNAFDSKDNDFCGFFDNAIISLFEELNKNNIKILKHPILMSETIEHIKEWDNRERKAKTSIDRNKKILSLIGVDVCSIEKQLDEVNIYEALVKALDNLYSNAYVLEYPCPNAVFEKYFNKKPPFSEKKKNEFPDAFVIESILDYIEKNDCTLLVISNDGDWNDALKEQEKVVIVKDINEALEKLQKLSEELIDTYLGLEKRIIELVKEKVFDEQFYVDDYITCDNLQISNVDVFDDGKAIVPLKITDNELILQKQYKVYINGEISILNTDNSIWDSERKVYIMTEFSQMEFDDAIVTVIAEVVLKKNSTNKYCIDKVNIVNGGSKNIKINSDKVQIVDVNYDIDEVDIKGEMYDALEEYYFH